ncbi:hypothetical protein BESB_054890 [Besnoitia besnoiti]|uniref:Uncharacterized protein n=1 Tax=Besnoitia besnoiti TaxID=94643 RepID=A0A2A9MBH5_BESBE|nr:hypothetical protein BESB_054890 [Besnoitia besnoiti]PFH35838.1 hypothetical protein BESB_054890 [Besnoitia besnoiti]
MARRNPLAKDPLHDDSLLMIPPPGFKFIPKSEVICGKAGCFECFDIYCERCESKDRRIVELEMRNNDLVKYITQLQAKLFGSPSVPQRRPPVSRSTLGAQPSATGQPGPGYPGYGGAVSPPAVGVAGEPFAFIQSPVLYDPSMDLSYVATTSFAPAPPDSIGGPPSRPAGRK